MRIPFHGARGAKTLCVIGQNPSAADEMKADKTIRYLEELIYLKQPEYSTLLILNLYSRVDTTKSEKHGLLDSRCAEIFDAALLEHDDFLVVYGKLKNERAYRFPERARQVCASIKAKNVFKLDLGTEYAPHPGNRRILYKNFGVRFAAYDFGDVQPDNA